MRRPWALLLVAALLVLPAVRADPALSSPASGQGLAEWTFSNPANYTLANASLSPNGASLAWSTATATDTTQADFAQASALENVNLTASPGDVVIDNTSKPGPVQNLTFQPTPAQLSDNYLYKGNGGNPNFGLSPELKSGNWGGGEWSRAILQFPALPLPANATLVGARLALYFYDPITTNPMDYSAHRMLDSWTELGSNWDTRDGVTPWNTTGGDFDPTALDTVSGIAATPGWFSWNVTGLVQGWWTGTIPNDGLMVRQVSDNTTVLGEKGFYSSDSTNTTLRPELQLTYTTPGSRGILVSRALDAGGRARWGSVWWNATVPAGTAVAVETRSGDTFPADASWSAWSAAYAGPGVAIASPPARYLEYEVILSTDSATSPSVHDVTVGWGRYATAGALTTQALDPPSLEAWGNLSLASTAPAGTSVALQVSQDNGSSWVAVADGQNLSSRLLLPIRVRILLATNDTTLTPAVATVSLAYRVAVPGGTGPLPAGGGSGVPWWALGLLALALGALLVVLALRGPTFAAVGLLLIHADGRLVTQVGRERLLRDELATSAMLTLVLQFVRDSFRDAKGGGGELKSLEVDDRGVSIVKGDFLYLALIGEGTPPAQLSERMTGFLRRLEAEHGRRLQAWDGLRSGLDGLQGELEAFLEKGYRRSQAGEDSRYRG